MVRILSVDWDFFFEDHDGNIEHPHTHLYDWSHRESSLFILGGLWYIRASGFMQYGLPLPGMNGEQHDFWQRFRFRPRAGLMIAESHSTMLSLWRYVTRVRRCTGHELSVVSYDAHHDAGYNISLSELSRRKAIDCGQWVAIYGLAGTQVEVVYPRWKKWAFDLEPAPTVAVSRRFDDGASDPEPFDYVFICRSGAWVPPWTDDAWQPFIDACPARRLIPHKQRMPEHRNFDLAVAKTYVSTMACPVCGRHSADASVCSLCDGSSAAAEQPSDTCPVCCVAA